MKIENGSDLVERAEEMLKETREIAIVKFVQEQLREIENYSQQIKRFEEELVMIYHRIAKIENGDVSDVYLD